MKPRKEIIEVIDTERNYNIVCGDGHYRRQSMSKAEALEAAEKYVEGWALSGISVSAEVYYRDGTLVSQCGRARTPKKTEVEA